MDDQEKVHITVINFYTLIFKIKHFMQAFPNKDVPVFVTFSDINTALDKDPE